MDNIKLDEFLCAKDLEGCSKQTLKLYSFTIKKLLEYYDNKQAIDISTMEIRNFLIGYKENHKVSNVTLDNMRCIFQSFYNWLFDEGYVIKNPMDPIKKIKAEQIIKSPFTEEELEILRNNCKDIREKAILEMLYSSGMRVGELALLNIKDIDFINNKTIIFGKGAKEREAYFTVKARMLLQEYLKTRTDNNEALFVGSRAPHNRLQISAYQKILRELGERSGIKCHPHKFRRTCATTLLNKGMSVEEISKLLGHAKIETTMGYCQVNQNRVRDDHSRYMN